MKIKWNNLSHILSLTGEAACMASAPRANVLDEVEERLVRTLLSVADHHELLADVSAAVHRDEKLSHIFLHWVDLFRKKHCRLCAEEKRRRGSDRKEKRREEKRVMICIIMSKKRGKGKKAHYIRPSRTDAGFCSVPGTFLFRNYWSWGPAVRLLYSKITLHRSSRFWSNQRCSSKGPLRKFFLAAWRVALNYTCKPLTANQPAVLHIHSSRHGGVSDTVALIVFFSLFPPRLWEGVCDWEKNWEQLKAPSIKAKESPAW